MNQLKKLSIILILALYFLINTSFASTLTGEINVSAVRLRKEANTTSTVLTNIYKGEDVEILETNGQWCKVKYEDNVGYIKKEFVDIEETNNSKTTNTSAQSKENNNTNSTLNNTVQTDDEATNNMVQNSSSNALITNSVVKMRLLPNFMSKANKQIEAGIQVAKIEEMNNWIKVSDGTLEGWILKNKVSVGISQVTAQSSDFEKNQNNQTTEQENGSKIQNNTKNEIQTNTLKTSQKTNTQVTNTQIADSQSQKEQITEVTTNQQTNSVSKTGIVNVETAKVREGATLKSKVIGFLDYNDEITITGEDGDWYKITHEGMTGYVNKPLVTVKKDEHTSVTSRSLTEERENVHIKSEENKEDQTTISKESNEQINEILLSESTLGNQSVVDYAKQFLGYGYVVGGKNPSTGFDCSGYTRYVFANFGVNLGSTAASQDTVGTVIARENLLPGDLILFYDEGKTKIGHTGIYISNGDFIHAANPSRGVVIDNINTSSYYNTRFITARRIVE